MHITMNNNYYIFIISLYVLLFPFINNFEIICKICIKIFNIMILIICTYIHIYIKCIYGEGYGKVNFYHLFLKIR